MKLLVIDADRVLLDLCLRASDAGHDVIWWIPQTASGRPSPIGDGYGIRKVKSWEPHAKWADLIVTGDNAKYTRNTAPLFSRGYPIFGCNPKAAQLELDRGLGQSICEDYGIPTLPYVIVDSYDDAIKHVEKTMGRFVSKPWGGDADKALSYVAGSPEDMIFKLEHWKKKGRLDGQMMLQERVDGIEMAVGGWFSRAGWSEYLCENFEEKKFMNDGLGQNCYSADTEVLTDSGWKYWPDVVASDLICTLVDGEIKYEVPKQLIKAAFEGEMIGWKSPHVDILVTPGHRMYVQDDHSRKPFFFEPSDETETQTRKIAKASGVWFGVDDDSQLPKFFKGTMKNWAALLGAYIADGNKHGRSVVFGNCPEHKQPVFISIAKDCGYEAKMYGKDLYINSKEVADYMASFGLSHEKYIPTYIKNSTTEVLSAFLHGYATGDGSNREGNRCYTTVSKRLADDLQEVLLKVGKYGGISTRDRTGESHFVNGYECVNRRVAYEVRESGSNLKAKLSPDICYRTGYQDFVYCCEVTSHIIYVRRNGKACWLGQTGEQGTTLRYVQRSKLFDETLAPVTDYLHKIDYVGYVDMNTIIEKSGRAWPLEFTMRFGYPLNYIQEALHLGDPIEWMLDAVNGRNTLRVSEDVAVGVVFTHGHFPNAKEGDCSSHGFPMYGIKPSMERHLHMVEMQWGEAPLTVGSKIKQVGMPLTAGCYNICVTGTGEKVSDAQKAAYDVIWKLKPPTNKMFRTDIGCRLEEQLPILQSKGYAERLKY